MKEANIMLKINDYFLETNGILNNDILSFYDNDKLRTNIIYDYKNNTLIRDNEEITIKLYFNKEKENIEYYLKKEEKRFYDNFIKMSLHINNKNVIINYRIDENTFIFNLSYKEVEKE